MNKIKWDIFFSKIFTRSYRELEYSLDPNQFPALFKLKPLSTIEIIVLSKLIKCIQNTNNKGYFLSFESLLEFLKFNEIGATQLNIALLHLAEFNLIYTFVHFDSCKKHSSLAFCANENILIEKGIYFPEKKINIWDLPNLNKG